LCRRVACSRPSLPSTFVARAGDAMRGRPSGLLPTPLPMPCPFVSAQRRPRIARCRGIGKATSSWAANIFRRVLTFPITARHSWIALPTN
jgi:hypothetical protein